MRSTPLTDRIVDIRARAPERIAQTLADRPRGTLPEGDGTLMIIACDHPARGVVGAGLDGGKMLLRVNYEDPRTADTLAACARAVDDLAERGVMAMVEPFISRWSHGRVVNDLSPDAVIASMAIASGLGRTSAYTWLKLPAVADMERVMEASTLPALILGGAVSEDPGTARASWARALALPTVKGLVIGRSLLFPPDDDVAGAVDNTVGLLS